MRKILIVIFLIILTSNCSHKLLKKAPVLAPAETFYLVEKEKYQISHNKCKKLKGKDRKCKKRFFEVGEMWDLFYPGFILIKKDTVFR